MKAGPKLLAARKARGAAARRAGHRREWLAALWLLLKGYRILGFRLKTRQGEIDLLAKRGRVLAVVEVKSRATPIAALEAVGADQRARLTRAGRAVMAGRPSLKGLDLRLDLIALSPRALPRHIPNAWPQDGF